jgi:hypothetical protein
MAAVASTRSATSCGPRLESRLESAWIRRLRAAASAEWAAAEPARIRPLEQLLAEPNRVRRVENIREGMREADSAHETTPVMKRPGDSASLRISACPTLADPEIDAWEGIPRS